MLIDLIPEPPAWAVITFILAWDVGILAFIGWTVKRPAKRHRFKAPPVDKTPRRNRVIREHRDGDLW